MSLTDCFSVLTDPMPDDADDSAHTVQPDSDADHHMETASHEMIHLENMDTNSTMHSGKGYWQCMLSQ